MGVAVYMTDERAERILSVLRSFDAEPRHCSVSIAGRMLVDTVSPDRFPAAPQTTVIRETPADWGDTAWHNEFRLSQWGTE